MIHKIFSSLFLVFSLISCSEQQLNPEKVNLSNEFKSYWFDGKAEISTYSLSQSRYGEMRSGQLVSIFVTEDFLKKEQVNLKILFLQELLMLLIPLLILEYTPTLL